MVLCLIGMSGSGKTYWSRRLAEAGYEHFDCDQRIEQRLREQGHVRDAGGIAAVAKWMGQPYEPGFAAREAAYLAAEYVVMAEILDHLDARREQAITAEVAIDTTGSVVYLGEKTCCRLQALSTIVYLENSHNELELMFRQYLADPKPVVWGGKFRPRKGESNKQALARCYRELLQTRQALYARYAAVKLSAARLRREPLGHAGFLRLVRERLESRS